MTTPKTRDALHFPPEDIPFLQPYLPPTNTDTQSSSATTPIPTLPFTTLTFATSLDSTLSLTPPSTSTTSTTPTPPTILSGPATKALTHYLRSVHSAILIGVTTAILDNPSLNCRISGSGGYGGAGLSNQPQPIILDPSCRWDLFNTAHIPNDQSKLLELVKAGKGKAPWIVTCLNPDDGGIARENIDAMAEVGGKYIYIPPASAPSTRPQIPLQTLLATLSTHHAITSIMIEGGATIINTLLHPSNAHLVNSVIVTIAPVWLGQGGSVVSPDRRVDEEGNAVAALRLKGVGWRVFGDDVVLCGRIGG